MIQYKFFSLLNYSNNVELASKELRNLRQLLRRTKTLKALSNNLIWYEMQWYNILKSYYEKTTKNHSRKKQENKNSLAGPFNNLIMYLAILIFGSEIKLLFGMLF